MKLTKKHIGKLFAVEGHDGSWVYQLVDVKKGWLLFYDFHGTYYKEPMGICEDWLPFAPRKSWPKDWASIGWKSAKTI